MAVPSPSVLTGAGWRPPFSFLSMTLLSLPYSIVSLPARFSLRRSDMSTAERQLFDVPLQPSLGNRFQPTGFPDIGAADFERPVRLADGATTWLRCLLVESAQSMANRLEATAW